MYRRVSVKCIQEIPVDTRKSIRRDVSTIEELMIKCDVFFLSAYVEKTIHLEQNSDGNCLRSNPLSC